MRLMKTSLLAAAVCAVVAGMTTHVSAITLEVTSLDNSLSHVDTVTKVSSSDFTSPIGSLDSLFYLPDGSIVYDVETEKQVHIYNPGTGVDTTLETSVLVPTLNKNTPTFTGFSTELLDMALEPGQTSFLLSDHKSDGNGGGVYRITIPTSPGLVTNDGTNVASTTVTRLVSGSGYQGIAFDPANSANPFYVANDGTNGVHVLDEYSSNGTTLLSQLVVPTPSGGSTSGTQGEIDGLTWDPFTKELWGAVKFGGIAEFFVDPVTFQLTTSILFNDGVLPPNTYINDVDGITTDGVGNLYFVVRSNTTAGVLPALAANTVGIFNTTTHTFSEGSNPGDTNLADLDDLAPAAGLGSLIPNNPVPLPASVWTGLSLLAGLGLFSLIRRRKLATVRAR